MIELRFTGETAKEVLSEVQQFQVGGEVSTPKPVTEVAPTPKKPRRAKKANPEPEVEATVEPKEGPTVNELRQLMVKCHGVVGNQISDWLQETFDTTVIADISPSKYEEIAAKATQLMEAAE